MTTESSQPPRAAFDPALFYVNKTYDVCVQCKPDEIKHREAEQVDFEQSLSEFMSQKIGIIKATVTKPFAYDEMDMPPSSYFIMRMENDAYPDKVIYMSMSHLTRLCKADRLTHSAGDPVRAEEWKKTYQDVENSLKVVAPVITKNGCCKAQLL